VVRSVTAIDAWALDPIGKVVLGGISYEVPPLTLAKFQRLLALDSAALMAGLANGNDNAILPFLAVACPHITEDVWRQDGSMPDVAELFMMFIQGHDWKLIGEAMNFGEALQPGEKIPTRVDVTKGLLAIARETGYKLEELLGMRVDGFYRFVEAIKSKHTEENASAEDDAPDAMLAEYGGKVSESLLDSLSRAERNTDG